MKQLAAGGYKVLATAKNPGTLHEEAVMLGKDPDHLALLVEGWPTALTGGFALGSLVWCGADSAQELQQLAKSNDSICVHKLDQTSDSDIAQCINHCKVRDPPPALHPAFADQQWWSTGGTHGGSCACLRGVAVVWVN